MMSERDTKRVAATGAQFHGVKLFTQQTKRVRGDGGGERANLQRPLLPPTPGAGLSNGADVWKRQPLWPADRDAALMEG